MMKTKRMIRKINHTIGGLSMMMLFLGLATACGDDKDDNNDPLPEDGELVLKADKESVDNSGYDAVNFTVWLGEKDVTTESSVVEQFSHRELKDKVFTPTDYTKGNYAFKATYRKYESREVKIKVKNGDTFQKHAFLMYLTSVYCPNCPLVTRALEEEVAPMSPGRIDIIALHGDMEGIPDPYTSPFTLPFLKYFNKNGYPTVMIDHQKEWKYEVEEIASSLEKIGNVGIALTTVKPDADRLLIEVKVKSRKNFEKPCRVAVVLVEDQLKANGDVFNWVVREYLTDMYGDEEDKGTGSIAREKEWTKKYEVRLTDKGYNLENMRVMAYVLSSEKEALNSRQVKAGESVDYELVHD